MPETNLMDTYELRETLGIGGGGTVIKAYHKRLRKDVVVKKLHSDIQNDEEMYIEADVLKNLHHQYLPQVYDCFVIDGISYTVMDYVQGESFGQMLARGVRFSERKVLKYAKQICEALDYLHSQKFPVIHGDIKPDNIMLTPEDNVCLIDFNISGISRNGHAVTFGYTEGYGAPEQYREFQRIWALMAAQADDRMAVQEADRTEKPDCPAQGAGRTEKLNREVQGAGRTEKLDRETQGAGRTEKLNREAQGAGQTGELTGGAQGAGRTEKLNYQVQETGGSAKQGRLMDAAESGNSGSFAGRGNTVRLGSAPAPEKGTKKLDFDRLNGGEAAGESAKRSPEEAWLAEDMNPVEPAVQVRAELTEGIPIDKRSDIYSLGATLYHIYSGHILSRDARNAISSRTSEGFLYILNKALQENPGDRYQNAGQMLAAVSNLYKHDSRYRNMKVRHAIAYLVTIGMLLCGVYLVLQGREVYRDELIQEYDACIESMAEAREARKETDFQALFQEAVDFMPDRLDAYYQKALFFLDMNQYQDAINFVRETLDGNSEFYSQSGTGDMYYIMGTAYFELMNYESAANAFANAIKHNGDNSAYYTDQAIAFARIGNTAQAKEVLGTARAKGALNDTVYLVSGEIKLAEGDYPGAEADFRQSIEEADSGYTCMRGYVMCGKAILGGDNSLESVEKGIALSGEALDALPNEYHAIILEQLVGMYMEGYEITQDSLYAQGALDTLQRIIAAGWATFTTYDNMVNIYYRVGDYEAEALLLTEMEQKYPENYKVPMKQAFLEAALQSGKPQAERDYSSFAAYYGHAQEIYAAVKKDGWSDSEMQVLENAYRELVEGHWIE